MKYIPLNIKTEYDLMNSLIKIDELISFALENNINSLGITDENMFGTYEFINKCKSNNIKPIIGVEFFIEETNFLAYAKNYEGYVSLCKLVSKKNIDKLSIEDLIKESNNLIIVKLIIIFYYIISFVKFIFSRRSAVSNFCKEKS